MKPILYFLTLGLILLISAVNVSAQGFNSVFLNDPLNIVAVGDNGKIVRSFNGGNSWSRYINGSENLNDVHISGNLVWIAGGNGNVLKTSKGISPIESKPTGVTSSLNSIFFIDEQTGFVCGDNGLILKTTDGGDTWNPMTSGTSADLNSISFKDANHGVAVGANGTYIESNDGGSTWSPVATGTQRNLRRVIYFTNGTATVGEWGTLLLRPDAQSFTNIDTRTNSDIRGLTGTSLSDLTICGGGGYIRNNSNGDLFLSFEINPMQGDLNDLCYFGDLGIAVSKNHEVIIRTTDGGTEWNFTGGVTKTVAWDRRGSFSGGIGNNLCPHPTNRDAVYVAYGNRVYISWDRGENWNQIATMSIGSSTHSFYVNPIDTNIWMAAIESSPDRVIRSTNYGATWSSILSINFSNYGQPMEQDQNDPSRYYFAPDNGGFWVSTDFGASFTEVSGNYPFRSPCDIMVEWGNSDVIFVADGVTGSGLADMFRTTNGGVNWTKVMTVNSGSEIPSMCNTAFNPDLGYATTWSSSDIYKTTNGGVNWNFYRSTGASGWASDICREDPTCVLTGSYGSGAFYTTNDGQTWTSMSVPGPGTTGAGQIYIYRDLVLDMRTSAMYKMKFTYSSFLTDITVHGNGNLPNDFVLNQNFPNPFNPVTQINFSIPLTGIVTLKVYDQLGKEVATLVNENKNAGNYSVDFDGSNLSSGVYFYRLQSGEFISTKKMILIK